MTPEEEVQGRIEDLRETIYHALGAAEDLVRAAKHLTVRQKAEIGKIIAGAVIDHVSGALPPKEVVRRLQAIIDEINVGYGAARPVSEQQADADGR